MTKAPPLFWKLYIGPWQRHTRTLTLAQEGAYCRLLTIFYECRGQPLPADREAVYRLAGAKRRKEREAVDLVLERFWDLGPAGWTQARAVKEAGELTVMAGHKRRLRQAMEDDLSFVPNEENPKNPAEREIEREEESLAKAKGCATEVISGDSLFTQATRYLEDHGTPEKAARSLLGKWRKEHGADLVAMMIMEARDRDIAEPVGYITKAFQERAKRASAGWN